MKPLAIDTSTLARELKLSLTGLINVSELEVKSNHIVVEHSFVIDSIRKILNLSSTFYTCAVYLTAIKIPTFKIINPRAENFFIIPLTGLKDSETGDYLTPFSTYETSSGDIKLQNLDQDGWILCAMDKVNELSITKIFNEKL